MKIYRAGYAKDKYCGRLYTASDHAKSGEICTDLTPVMRNFKNKAIFV